LLLFEGQGQKLDLLLIDMHLPGGMPGHELAKRLCQGKPGLKVLYTGDGEAVPEEGAVAILTEGAAFIPKPYTPDKLLCAVQASLSKEG
jgi:DNA-binding response OmpR family regulator